MCPTNVAFKKYNKKDRSPCLIKRSDWPILPHLCLYIVWSLEVWVFKVTLE